MSKGGLDNIPALFDRLLVKSHAGVVMASVAGLENDLERCIRVKMRPLSESFRKRLFTGYGPISTLSAKIDLTFALSIIDKTTFNEINKIKQIRNKLAHHTEWVSLDEEPVLTLFKALTKPDDIKGSSIEIWMKCIQKVDDPLEKFLVANGVTEDISKHNLPKS